MWGSSVAIGTVIVQTRMEANIKKIMRYRGTRIRVVRPGVSRLQCRAAVGHSLKESIFCGIPQRRLKAIKSRKSEPKG